MAKQDEQLQEILDGMKKLIETSDLNQQQISAFQKQVSTLQSEIASLTEEVSELKSQNRLINSQFKELYKTQSLDELLDKMSSIGKDAINADECAVYEAGDEKGQDALKKTAEKTSFSVENGKYTMTVPLENQQGDVIGVVVAKRNNEQFNQADAKVFNLNDGRLGTIFRASLEKKIVENIAVTDKLTRLQNREGLSRFLKNEALSRLQDNLPVSLIMYDIDHFKGFNDTYGHDVGDKCLKLVADTLKNNIRLEDSGVFRVGGEELLVILPVNEEKAFEIAERLRHAVEAATLVVNEKTQETTKVTVSGGISEITPKPIELDKNRIEEAFKPFLKKADKALYNAKEAGRNRVYGSETLMKNHYSLPSPTELFEYWCEKHGQDIAVSVESVIGSAKFYAAVSKDLAVISNYNVDEQSITAYAEGKVNIDKNREFAVSLINKWDSVRNTIPQEAFDACYADIEAVRAMVYTPELIKTEEMVKEQDKTATKSAKTVERD